MTDRPPFVLLPSDMEEDDEVDPNECRVCHSPGFCPPGYEPTGICLSCAVDENERLREALEAIRVMARTNLMRLKIGGMARTIEDSCTLALDGEAALELESEEKKP